MSKKILLLGGSAQQVVAIEKAKEMGLYTVLCDYLADNPGQYVADKFYLISTTDKEAVLEVGQNECIDGVLAYASDPAAPTAAYVAEKLGLPGNPFESIELLCNKDKFRLFLEKHKFNTPKSKTYHDIETAIGDLSNAYFKFPVMVKPVDSSGSKGVFLLENIDNIEKYINTSLSYSRRKTIILEEYVNQTGYQVAGDGMSIDGKLVFTCFGNDHFNKNKDSRFVPISASFPCDKEKSIQEKIRDEIQRLINCLDLKSATYNFDIRVHNDEVYLMEIAPRSGGNYIPNVVKYLTQVDLVESAVKMAMGEKVVFDRQYNERGFFSYFAIHSDFEGILESIHISDIAVSHIVESHITSKQGDYIHRFSGANTALGCLIMKFDTMDQMLHFMDNHDDWCKINIKGI